MATFADRLTELAQARGLRRQDVMDACNAHKSTVSKWYSGVNVPERDKLELLANLLGVSTKYLVTGDDRAAQLSKNVKVVERAKTGDGITSLTVFKSLREALQNVNGEVLGEEDNALETLFVSAKWLADHGIDEQNVIAYRVPDEIQNPPLMPGSTALIDTADKAPVDGNIYAVNQQGLIRLWQVFNVPGGYRLVSPNRDYPDETCTADDAVIEGCVVRSYSPSLRR